MEPKENITQTSNAGNHGLRSDEVQDLLSEAPSSILRWSNLIIAVLVILVCGFSWFVKYPNVINGSATVSSEKPPIKVYNTITGQLDKISVANGAMVKEGQTIFTLKAPVSPEDISTLKAYLINVSSLLHNPESYTNFQLAPLLHLNQAQAEYNALTNGMANYRAYQLKQARGKGVKLLESKVAEYEQILKISVEERSLLEYEIEASRKQFAMQKKEFELGYISESEFLKSDVARVQAESRLKSIDKAMIQNKLTLKDYKRQLEEKLENTGIEQRELLQSIKSAYAILSNRLVQWEEAYSVKAPISGTIAFPKQLAAKQQVNANELVFTVIPNDRNFIVNAQVAPEGISKLKPGQLAKLKFNIYPSTRYGYVEGAVQSISQLPDEGMYTIAIALNQGLTSSYGKQLEYKPEMEAQMEVLTEDVRLFDRIFGSMLMRNSP